MPVSSRLKRIANQNQRRSRQFEGTPVEHFETLQSIMQDILGFYRKPPTSCTDAVWFAENARRAKQELSHLTGSLPPEKMRKIRQDVERVINGAIHSVSDHCREKNCEPITLPPHVRGGLSGTPEQHGSYAENILRRLQHDEPPKTCRSSVKALSRAAAAKYAADESGNTQLMLAASNTLKDVKRTLRRTCKERDCRTFDLDGLARVEMMNTRGFKEGKKAWIDVMPMGGPKMRVTHEVLGSIPPPVPAHAKRKCIAWRYAGTERRCALYSNETGFRTQKPPIFSQPLGELEGVGSSLALMWAAAGAVALVALSDAQRDKLFSPKPDANAEATLVSLNAARARQGLPPLTR